MSYQRRELVYLHILRYLQLFDIFYLWLRFWPSCLFTSLSCYIVFPPAILEVFASYAIVGLSWYIKYDGCYLKVVINPCKLEKQ